ncbi:MAG: [acyl-carrier-protein] S-malonyltransferase, partial [Candidatus Omnitrophica bacterium]|nr:[acyl-carrier-protein] S-malonyltransferase [Candidatus Omnitrophota bacterium]
TRPDEIKENLIKQITGSVLWEDSMKFLLSEGIKNFIEFGPGKVLKGLMRRIDDTAQVINIEKKEDILKKE